MPQAPSPRFGFLLPAALIHPAARIALLIGLGERIFWGMRRQIHGATGEAAHVAIAWAQGRGFADAFMPGQGPTAHLLPVTPLIGGIAYRLFGVESTTSEIVLFTLSQVVVFGAFLLMAKCFERLGSPPRAILAGFCLLCVLPIYTTVEAFDFRIWEGGYGLALGALALLVILSVDAGVGPRRAALWLAILPPVTFFVNPAIGLCAIAALAMLLWRRRAAIRPLPIMAGAALILAALVAPWMARNMIVMHHPIPLRDNVGLELAVGNFPAALAHGDFYVIFERHLQAIHPRDHPAPFRAMVAAGGEVAYARLMGDRAKAWIAAHPRDAVTLWVRHVREMLFTRTWMFQTAHGRQLPVIRATLASIVGLLGLAGLWFRVFTDRRSWYVALYVVLPVLFYFPFQPIMRYTWLLYPAMMYFAADIVTRAVRKTAASQLDSQALQP